MARLLQSRWLLLLVALGTAGCGSVTGPALAGNGDLTLSASAVSVGTNGQVELRAFAAPARLLPSPGASFPGPMRRPLARDTSTPPASTPRPGSLSADSIAVRVEAALRSDPKSTACAHPLRCIRALCSRCCRRTSPSRREPALKSPRRSRKWMRGSVKWSLAEAPAGGGASTNGALGTRQRSGMPAQLRSLHHLHGDVFRAQRGARRSRCMSLRRSTAAP